MTLPTNTVVRNTVVLPSEDERRRWCSRLMNNTNISFTECLNTINSTDFIIDEDEYKKILSTEVATACDQAVTLTHPAIKKYGDLSTVMRGVDTVQKMARQIKKSGRKYSSLISPDNQELQERIYNSYTGDVFEIFVEFLIKSNSQNRRIGIVGYTPVNQSNGKKDFGVDGYGISQINGRPATVQIKFRSEMMNYMLTGNKDHLTNFKNNSHETYGVNYGDVDNMLIVSTAGSIHHTTRNEMLNGKVRCLLLDQLEQIAHGVAFWDEFRRLLAK
jgi:hypothetical protein